MTDFGKHIPNSDTLVLPAIVVLVGLGAFGLGRLSALASAHTGGAPAAKTSGTYIASKGGGKYYLPGCPGVANIKDANRVWFDTVAEAQAAGYAPAGNCPGL